MRKLQLTFTSALCLAVLAFATGCAQTATTSTSAEGVGTGSLGTAEASGSGAWRKLTVTGDVPTARAYHAMVYGPETGRLLLFGGNDGDSSFDDTWAYDPASRTWVELLSGGPLPPGRESHAMVYDSTARQVILFGGWDDRRGRDLSDTWAYDPEAGAWTEILPTGAKPSARDGHSMIYDPASERVILFGGVDGVGHVLNDTWAYDSADESWTELDIEGATPPARGYTAMVYDPVGEQVLLFGGGTEEAHYNDTWAFDLATDTWTELRPPGDLPGKRSYHQMVYDSANARVLLYGGGTDRVGYWETWAYDPIANTWTDLDPPGGVPTVDRGHAMVYDPASGMTILFGGWGWDAVSESVWVYDPGGGSDSSPDLFAAGPGPRGYHDLVYDPVSGRAILFGGGTDALDYDDTWAYDPRANAWIELAPEGERPEGRSWPALAYDPVGEKALLFGGADIDRTFNDIWTYDPALNQWTELETGGELPPERWLPAVAYDTAAGALVLFGGGGVDGMLNDTWTFEPATSQWTARDPVGSLPLPRGYHSLVYELSTGTVILFGGMDDYDQDFGDTWSYAPSDNLWTEIQPSGATPSARSGHAMVYDRVNGKVILFGGSDSEKGFNDTWLYDPEAGTWEDAQPTGDLPSERAYHAMVYDSGTQQVILFGGFDGSEYVNDVWGYDPASNVWTELIPMTGGTTQAGRDMWG